MSSNAPASPTSRSIHDLIGIAENATFLGRSGRPVP